MVTALPPLPRPPLTSLMQAPTPLPRYMRPTPYPAGYTGDPNKGGGFLGNAMGWNGNPIYDGFKKIPSELLLTLGAGLMNGDPDWGMGEYAQMLPSIREEQRRKEGSQREIEMRDNYARILRNMGPDFQEMADAVYVGAVDPGQAWGEAIKMKGTLREQEEALRSARANAQFIKDPQLRQMVEAGALPFKDAYDYEREGLQPADPVSANISGGMDWGDPGAGFEWLRENGDIAIDERGLPIAATVQGGKPWQEAQDALNAAGASQASANTKANIVVEDIDRVITQIAANPMMTTGIVGQATGWLGGMPANDVAKLTDGIRANVGFDQLQAMREASPTGGALGPVSDTENRLLQSVLGSLDQSQNAQQLADNLIRVQNTFLDIVHGPGAGPPRKLTSFERAGMPKIKDQSEYARLPSGTKYIAPDGSARVKP